MSSVKKICYISVLTALYIVLSAFLRFTLIGNIQIDLGYIAFAVALCEFGISGALVGVIGCALESMLFSAYGFSISWVLANTIIGVGCGLMYKYFPLNKDNGRVIATILFVLIGVGVVKTLVECALYSIPFTVKIPKNMVAFVTDSAMMIAGLFVYNLLSKRHVVPLR